MTLTLLDWAVLLAYLAVVLLIGFHCARRNTSTEEYFVGGRRFRGWVIGLSLSSLVFLNPELALRDSLIVFVPLLLVTFVIAGKCGNGQERNGKCRRKTKFEHRKSPNFRNSSGPPKECPPGNAHRPAPSIAI